MKFNFISMSKNISTFLHPYYIIKTPQQTIKNPIGDYAKLSYICICLAFIKSSTLSTSVH